MLINKLFMALIAGALAFLSGTVLAQSTPAAPAPKDTRNIPLRQVDVEQAKAARAAAKEAWAKMTPEEQAAWKKKARAKRVADLSAMEEYAVEQGAVYDTEAAEKATARSKAMPARTDAQAKKAIEQQTKPTKGQ